MNSFKENISNIILRKNELYRVLEISDKQKKIISLEEITQSEKFWNKPNEAQKILKEIMNM